MKLKINYQFLFLTIILISFLLRIYRLSYESIWLDEATSIYVSKKNIIEIVESLSTDTQLPLYFIILHFWMKLFGDGEFSIRFISVFFGVMSIYIIYKFGESFNRETGLLAALLLSISLFHIRYSQEVRPYSLFILLVLLSSYYFIKLQEKDNKYDNRIGYIIFTAAMMYTHIYGFFYVIFQNIYLTVYKRKENNSLNSGHWIKDNCIIFLIFIPWILILIKQIVNQIGEDSRIAWLVEPTYITIYDTLKSFSGGEIGLYLFITIYIAIIIKKFYLLESYDQNEIFLLLWLFIPILMSFIISISIKPIYHDRYLIGSIPPLILIMSKNILKFKKYIILPILIILTLTNIFPIQQYYDLPDKEQWRELTTFIRDHKEKEDFIIIYKGYLEKPFKYYYDDSNFSGIYNVTHTDKFVKGYNNIWLITGHIDSKEFGSIKKILNNTYVIRDVIKFNKLTLYYYTKKQNSLQK